MQQTSAPAVYKSGQVQVIQVQVQVQVKNCGFDIWKFWISWTSWISMRAHAVSLEFDAVVFSDGCRGVTAVAKAF